MGVKYVYIYVTNIYICYICMLYIYVCYTHVFTGNIVFLPSNTEFPVSSPPILKHNVEPLQNWLKRVVIPKIVMFHSCDNVTSGTSGMEFGLFSAAVPNI